MTAQLPPLVFVSLEDWDEIWRRNQFLCAILSRRRRILFVGRPRTVRDRDFRWTVPVHPGVTFFRPWKVLPKRWLVGRLVNEWLFRLQLRALSPRRPVLWLNDHEAVHLVGHLDERAVVYDVTDDWTAFPQPEEERRRTVAQDAALTRVADAVIVCSAALHARKRGLCRRLYLIPNGVDLPHYERGGRGRPHDATWPSPAIGYTGTIHPSRVDFPLLETLAQALPDVSIVLIGPAHLPDGIDARLARLPNVFVTGPRPYAVLPDYMQTWAACITPHLVTPFTESLNPIKLWEYLAAGLPVVSTDVAGFRDFPDLVRVARSPAEFVEQVRAALQEGVRQQAARRAIAARNSWEQRAQEVSAILAQVGGS